MSIEQDVRTARPQINSLADFNSRLPDKPVSSDEAMTALVMADGDEMLAACRLGTRTHNIFAAIVQDRLNQDRLADYIRAKALINTLKALGESHSRVVDSMDDLNPRDQAKLYIGLLEAATKLTEKDSGSAQGGVSDPVDALMRRLPPSVQDAFAILAEQKRVGSRSEA